MTRIPRLGTSNVTVRVTAHIQIPLVMMYHTSFVAIDKACLGKFLEGSRSDNAWAVRLGASVEQILRFGREKTFKLGGTGVPGGRLRLRANPRVSLRVSSAYGYRHVSERQQGGADVEKADAGPGSRKGGPWSACGESRKHAGAVQLPRCNRTVHR